MNYSDAEIRKQGQLVKKRNHNNNKGKDQTLLSYSNKKKKKMLRHERKRYPLLCFWELPEYMKDNEYILRYYRANWPLKQALFSVFRWHNETLNVWTHLLGFLLFLGLTLANLMKPGVVDLLGLFSRSFSSSAEKNVSHSFKDLFLGTTTILFDLKQQAPMKMEPKSLDLVIAA
ncbi:heptahelical transmembrane protein ADIPOR1, partial [Arachis duranensis]|uniref:Heptahelical transmembrane protein ADIPOR1 n=1 Tax=Arachis duranensis TaxID=130453 RepID=A0A6P4BUX4_ARADU